MSPSSRGPDSHPPQDLFGRVFEQLPERKIIFTAQEPYTFIAVTDGHLKLTGMAREQVLGGDFFTVFPDTSEAYKETGKHPLVETFKLVAQSKREVNETMRYDIPDGNGKFLERWWRVTHFPIFDNAGKVEFILQQSTNVTAEVTAERDFKELREQLDDALAIGKVGSWVWDVEHNVVVADANLAKMFGMSVKEAKRGMSVGHFTDIIHVEDRLRVQKSIERAIADNTVFEEEYRIAAVGKKVRWVLARGRIDKSLNRTMFPGVIVDITERRNLQAEVELARQQDQLNRRAAKILQGRNDQLEALSRTKDEFVALASHQLRTPATAVKQYIGMVLQGYVGPISEIQTEMLEKAFESNERQIQIINQILNAARVDTGRLIMTPSPIDLRALAEGVAHDMQSSVKAHDHTLAISLTKAPVTVLADPGYIRMVIENIIGNAVVYTPNGGTITLKLEKLKKECRISISDTGVGIKKADITKLFTKFSRIHNPLSVQAGGSGIGLYLAAEIVRLHRGSISVESHINKGTTFAISLPLSQNELVTKGSN